MTRPHVIPVEQPNSDTGFWAAWLQLELELDPTPIVQLAAAPQCAPRCPLCGAAMVDNGAALQCPDCGMVAEW